MNIDVEALIEAIHHTPPDRRMFREQVIVDQDDEIVRLRVEIEIMDRQRRKLISEVDSYKVEIRRRDRMNDAEEKQLADDMDRLEQAKRRDKLGTPYEMFCAGWCVRWQGEKDRLTDGPQESDLAMMASDWEIYKVARGRVKARTQEASDEQF